MRLLMTQLWLSLRLRVAYSAEAAAEEEVDPVVAGAGHGAATGVAAEAPTDTLFIVVSQAMGTGTLPEELSAISSVSVSAFA